MKTNVKFGIAQVGKPTPVRWGRISSAMRYFFVGATAIISATDVVPVKTIKYTVLALSLAILLLKAIDMGLDIQVEEEQQA